MPVPLMIDEAFLKPLIVGCGPVACMKAEALCRHGVRSRMVGPEPPRWNDLIQPAPQWEADRYRSQHLEGATLVVAATDDVELNGRICDEARMRGILAVNVSDGSAGTASLCREVTVGDLTVTVSTGGASPAAGAEIIRSVTAHLKAEHWPERLALLRELRQILKERETDGAKRRETLKTLAALPLESLVIRRQEYED